MSFGLGFILFLLGSALIALFIWAVPGPAGATSGHDAAGHDHGHGHGGH